jgi:thiol:disulfide interchange protein DsbD
MHTRRLILFLLALWAWSTAIAAEPEFLTPDEAFVISAGPSDTDTVRVVWRIADGYYMYRSKFRFLTDTPGVRLGQPQLPASETKDDPIFGAVEIYRGDLTIELPVELADNAPDLLTLKAKSQGCADAGLCYPPQTQTLLVGLTAAADAPLPVDPRAVEEMRAAIGSPSGSGDTGAAAAPEPALEPIEPAADQAGADALAELSALGDSLGLGDDDILSPEEAFKFSAEVVDERTLRLVWQIAEGTYLYADKVQVALAGDGVALGELALPEPKIKQNTVRPDGEIGDVAVFVDGIDLSVPLLRSSTAAATVELTAKYQGCAERGICYPPQQQKLTLSLPAGTVADSAAEVAAAGSGGTAATPPSPAGGAEPLAEQDQIAAMLAGGSSAAIVGTFFVIGLLLAFTPCVFPMIPILSGIIAGQGTKITTRKAFVLSLVYVLAMAVTYTIAGVLAGMFGSNLQAAFQNPWIIGFFAAIFVALAFSMFGFYELQLPSSLQSKLSEWSNKQEGGTLTGVAIMGLLSALIVGPCVAPPLAGALIYIGQTGDALLGGLALFAMSLGMGAPLVAIGTSAGKLLPRAGAWMDAVKAVFGVLMLGVAVYLLERVIPESVAMLLWGTLLVVSGVYMGALRELPVEASGWHKLWKGLGVVVLLYGALFVVGVAAGGKDTMQPLRGVVLGGGAGGGAEQHLSFKRIKSVADLERELAAAKAAGRPVMLDFYADWCVYCKQMEKNTFPDPAVQAALADAVLLQADVTDQDDADLALQRQIGIPAPPAMIFWDGSGAERRNFRLLGYMGPSEFAEHVRRALQ